MSEKAEDRTQKAKQRNTVLRSAFLFFTHSEVYSFGKPFINHHNMKLPFRFFPLRSLLTLFVIFIFLGITGCKSPEPVITEPEATDEVPSVPATE